MKTKTLEGFACEQIDNFTLVIHTGIMFAYGYIGCLPEPTTFYFNPTAATQYHFIYGELDKSVVPNTFIVKVKNNQGGANIKDNTFRQDVLSAVKTGVYQLPLWRITLNSSGIAEITNIMAEQGTRKNSIKKVRHAVQTHLIRQTISPTATVEATPATSDSSGKIATTMFVHNACRDYIDNN